jgi:hypothetical protein
MIVALPYDANCTPSDSPEIAAALGIIKSIAKADINKMKGFDFIYGLCASSYCKKPFAEYGSEVGKALGLAMEDLRMSGIIDTRVFIQIDKTYNYLLDPETNDVPWSPFVLINDVHAVEDRLNKHADNWMLLRHWQGWLSETKDIRELHRMFRELVDTLPGISKRPKRNMLLSNDDFALFNAFLKRLESLGIPYAQKELDPDAWNREQRRRDAVRLKRDERQRKYEETKAKSAPSDPSGDAQPDTPDDAPAPKLISRYFSRNRF